MKSIYKYYLSIVIVYFSSAATALDIGASASQSALERSVGIFADGDFNTPLENDETTLIYNWNLAYTHSQVESKDSLGNIIKDINHDYTVGAGIDVPAGWFGNLDLHYATSPDEGLVSSGPTLKLGYTYNFSSPEKMDSDGEKDSDNEFQPNLGFSLAFSSISYKQSFSSSIQTRRRGTSITRPVTGSNTINQRSTSFSLYGHPLQWLNLNGTYTKYNYDKNINDFLQYIDGRQEIASTSSGILNALSGFADRTTTLRASFRFLEIWQLDLENSVSKIISDDSTSTTNRAEIYVTLSKWKIGLGDEVGKSTSSGTDTTNTVLFDVDYFF